MRLTNTQMDIICNSIYNKLREESLKDYSITNMKSEYLKDKEIKITQNKIDKYLDTKNKITELNVLLNNLKKDINNSIVNIRNNNGYFSINENTLNDAIDFRIDSEINKNMPSKQEIKARIILNSIEGSKDLINDVINSFK